MFPTGNPPFTAPNAQQNANNSMNLAAALYLHPSLGITNQAYTQFYQQAQSQAQLTQQQQQQHLQRQFEQLVVAQAAQNAHLQAIQQQQQQQQQHAFQTQQAQAQNQKMQVAQQQAQLQQSQAQAVQIQRLNALRQSNQQMSHSPSMRGSTPGAIKSRQEIQAEVDARRRRSLIADFMVATNSATFLDERRRSDSIGGGILGEMKKSETMGSEFSMIADETTERKKNSITDHLEAVEKEKKLVDSQITIIQRKKEQYENELSKISSDSTDNDKENDDSTEDIDSMSLVERIYAENRKKAFRSEAQMPAHLLPSAATVPQYRNPWDSPLVQETIERYKMVKPYLVKMLTEHRQNDLLAQKYQTEKYNMMYAEWLKKDERYCKSQKKIARDEKHREIFEKTFPELKKTREERERCGRIGLLSTEQLEQEDEYKRRRAAAALPPIMMNSRMRSAPFYIDLNGVVLDALEDHNAHIEYFLGKWTDDEKKTFREQIVTYGKNFAAIAEFLDRKSVKDCVLYYYLTKKRQNYKALMGKKRKKPPRCYKPPVMPRLEEVALKAPQAANDVTIVGSRELECCICKAKVNSGSNTGRILTRLTLDASGYDASSANEIDICVCQKCKAKGIKPKTVTRCQIGTCHNPRRKVKPTRPMPVKWKLITDEQKQFLMHQMLIPEDILKCCPACHKKISKQLDMLIAGELEEEMALWKKSSVAIWSSEEVETLRAAVTSVGEKDWSTVAEKMSNKYSAKQCREQYEKIHAMGSVKKEAESEDDVSEDDKENPQLQQATVAVKNDIAETEADPRFALSVPGESSASADEAANQDDCVILLPPLAKSPSTQLYKPRFRGTSGLGSEVLSVGNSHLHLSQVGKESEVMSSPLTCRKSDASVSSSSDLSNADDVTKTTSLPPQSSFVGSALLATLTSSTPDSMPTRSAQLDIDRLPQYSVSITRSSTSAVTQSASSALGNIVKGSITQGTPVMRPPSSPTPSNDLLLEKMKQMQMLSAGTVATGASLAAAVAAANNIATSSTPPIPTPALQPNANAAVALPFLQNSLAAAAAAAFPTAGADPNMSSLAAFYNQFAAMDPAMQYAMTMKIMQQAAQQHEYERRLAALRASSVVDQYRQQALALGLSEQQQQQQVQNSHQQQQMNALANDQAKLLLWQQLMQQSTIKPLQQQTVSQAVNLQRTAAANTLLAAAAASTSVHPSVAAHLSAQPNVEQQQQQAKQLIASATPSTAISTMTGRVATGNTEPQRTNVQSLSSTASQLYNDFRNAEQMRKELDENMRQLEAQQKLQEEIRYIEQQRRRVVEEEARIGDELSRVSQIEYPRALRSQDVEAVRVHLQTIERLKERRTAMQHYLRAYDEGLKALSGRNALTSTPSSGVIVRGMCDERTTVGLGPVSKGAMKEFPPSVTRIGVTPSSSQAVSGQSLIGIKRTLNDSALATAVEGRLPRQSTSNDSTALEECTKNRSSRIDPLSRKGLDSTMFDSGQTSHLLRQHCHNVTFDEEFNRAEHRNMQNSCEIKRKSGIHTVYLPSVSDVHHAPSVKTSAGSQKRVGSPTITATAHFTCTTPNNSAPTSPYSQPLTSSVASVSISRTSPAQQQQHFPHFVPTLPQHQTRFSPLQSTSAPASAAISSHGLPATTILGRPVVSPVSSYTSGMRTPVPTLVSPRTPISINPNLSNSHSAHVSPCNSSSLRATTPTTSSPFQLSVLGTLSPNVSSQSISGTSTFQTSAIIPGNTLSASVPSLLVTNMADISGGGAKTITNVAENEEKSTLVENQQRSSEPTAVANYEPLSPDTSDVAPTSQTGTSTDQATNLPLFSFLNLPDSGNGTLSAPTIRPVISPDDSSSNMRNIPTGNIIPPQLTTTTVTTSGNIMLPIKPPPQPTYEPLSDDDD
ncbi:Myb-like DNA-binding domain containing protein [Brugia malayi]|uniref:Myb-like DNA-binding domain containing protein n=1 Tax=Brugia malayi TaxID=6279 RepID=A0A4E9F4Q7_BRUMA|nr:Myb-like DNA-binding domain containing protein [Brugia malayi]VIO90884.1 Myb-like DNA-binding domain containing protein [Brugia malayi]